MAKPSISRRTFLKVSCTAGGSLLVSAYFGAFAGNPVVLAQTASPTSTPTATPTGTPGAFEPNLFIRIDPDSKVTLTVPRSEMGQGVRTALAMMLAEELDADWATVHVEQAMAIPEGGGAQLTSGSGAITDSYAPLRDAGAKARAALINAAAQTWSVKPQECTTQPGIVVHAATNRQLPYGDLAGLAGTLKAPSFAPLKQPTDFRFIGKGVPRVDEPDIVQGKAIYGLDVRVPNMLFAAVARCPVPGGKVVKFDSSAAEKVPGVKKVVQVDSGVAVVAANTWAAFQGRKALQVNFDEGANAAFSTASIRQQLVELITQATKDESKGTLTTIDATFETPYLAHAALEPVNCIADVRSDSCEIWAPTQNAPDVMGFVRDAVGVPTKVHVTLLGGGFGRRLEVDFAIEAANVSKAVGAPVQLVWTREDDIQHDYYRQTTYHWLRAGWDNSGKLSLWRHYIAGPGLNGIAYKAGSDVLEEGLAIPYQVDDLHSQSVLADIPLPTGPWRAVMAAPNAFANECFLDQVAAALKQDPYQFRLDLLPTSDRLAAVLKLAADKANWSTPAPQGHARGIACHTYHDTSVAMVAEVSVDKGAVRVHKVVCAIDCGTIVHPDIVTQQMEGGIVFGLTSLLKNAITFKQGRVEQSNFNDYALLRMDEMPQIEVYLVPSFRVPQGAGEMGVPPLVPAVLNAVFALTGKSIHHIPLQPQDL